ncbi:MAG: hypothetical protein FWD62_12725 [Betaproteobacteria bacterium]|nr:hypothetical protein [Betaproteobacteria bacterium]
MKKSLIRDAREAIVSEAYQALPQPEPSEQLDVRIWARVADIVDTVETEEDAAIIPTPLVPFRWRRFTAPMALAVGVLLACAVGYSWLRGKGSALPAAENRTLIAAESSVREDAAVPEAPHANAEPAAADTTSLLPQAPTHNTAAKIGRELQRARAAQLMPQRMPPRMEIESGTNAVSLDAVAFEKRAVREKQADAAFRTKIIIPVQSAPVPNRPEKLAETKAAASAQLVLVRDLLREGRRNAAKQAFKSWRTTYPQAAVPDDLRNVAAEIESLPALPEGPGEKREP